MGLYNRARYPIGISAIVHAAPAASTTYYFGNAQAPPGLSDGAIRIFTPLPSTLQLVQLNIAPVGLGSAETGSIYLRVNATTDYLISSAVTWNTALSTIFNVTYPLVPDELARSDFFQIKIVTPAWATPPTNVYYFGNIVFANDT